MRKKRDVHARACFSTEFTALLSQVDHHRTGWRRGRRGPTDWAPSSPAHAIAPHRAEAARCRLAERRRLIEEKVDDIIAEKISRLEKSRKKLHGRCLELFSELAETRARVDELETLLYLSKHADKADQPQGRFSYFSDC